MCELLTELLKHIRYLSQNININNFYAFLTLIINEIYTMEQNKSYLCGHF